MGALEILREEELPSLVSKWREANPRIVQFWWDVQNAALEAVRKQTTISSYGLYFHCEPGVLFIRLPSGRRLTYVNPRIEINQFGNDCLTYGGEQTYGGKLTENITQAVARDCLAEAILRLDRAGYRIVMHIHDEVVADQAHGSAEEMSSIMAQPLPWAPDLPLAAEGFETDYYMKG